MLQLVSIFLIFLHAVNLGQSTHDENHMGQLTYKNQMRQSVNDLAYDIIAADQEASSFCKTNQDVVIKESYGDKSYIVSFTLPLNNSDQISVRTKHRVLFIEATNPLINFNYEYVVALTNILNTRALSWSFSNGTLTVSVPYKATFGVLADVSCNEDISSKIIYVPNADTGRVSKNKNGAVSKASSGGTATSYGSQTGASVGSGVTVGGNTGALAAGKANAYSASGTAANTANGGAKSDVTAVADASSKASAATSANVAAFANSPNSISKAGSVSKGGSYSGKVGSSAVSSSAAGAVSKDINGTRSTSGATGFANSYNVGGKKGISASNSIVTSGSISKGPDGIALSSSTSATKTISVRGKTKTSTVTTSSAITKDGATFSVKVTPKNNITKSIIDVNIKKL